MKLAGCFNGTKSSDMLKNQGKFDFSWNEITIFTIFMEQKSQY